ncbi:MAG: hypothetical protein ACK4SN_14410 [Bellilinea sp.]
MKGRTVHPFWIAFAALLAALLLSVLVGSVSLSLADMARVVAARLSGGEIGARRLGKNAGSVGRPEDHASSASR